MNESMSHCDNSLISVIIPVHNGARWLGATLESLYAQSYSHFEIVLVDDASTDALQQVLDDCRDERLRVEHLQNNVGVSAARNRGIELAKGGYIAFCDADDLCTPQRLERQLEFLERQPAIGLCGSAFTCFDDDNEYETVVNPQTDEEICKALMQGNCFGLSTIMARADLLKSFSFDPLLSVAEDYDLWTRLVAAGVRTANLPESLIRYRLHPQQASRHKGVELDRMSRRVRGLYCASLLGASTWVHRLRSGMIEPSDLVLAARMVAEYVVQHPESVPRDFRFMLAWLYQQLPYHGLRSWWQWVCIQDQLDLKLDLNYRLNITLLTFLPTSLGCRYLDTLSKLKS
jgi:glycosyltransferase involved in cell wall biosynthesis